MSAKHRPVLTRAALGHLVLYSALTVAVGGVARGLWPYLLPVRIIEGPLVQAATEDGATLVWYTTRHAHCQVRLLDDPQATGRAAESDGRRHRIRVDGLTAGTSHRYEIRSDGRLLHASAFSTNKPADASFGFIVFGDSGRGTPQQYKLAQRMQDTRNAGAAVDFLLHTGDVVYGAGQRQDYRDRFFAPYRTLIDGVCIWPSLGNHDVSEPNPAAAYREVFELPDNGPAGLTPEHNYWFDYGPARIVVADGNLGEQDLATRVAPWIRATFAAAPERCRWRFVVVHQPPYSAGPHGDDPIIKARLVPAIEESGVDIVFCGHDHLYERTSPLLGGAAVGQSAPVSGASGAAPTGSQPAVPKGVVYIITGAGGAKLYKARSATSRPAFHEQVIDAMHSFTHVTVDGGTLRLRQIAISGETIDEFQMAK